MKKRYFDWVSEYPKHVVIRKEGCFYTVRDNSAELVSEIMKYRLGNCMGHKVTGSPDLESMTLGLQLGMVNYIVIENNVIVEEFDPSIYGVDCSSFEEIEEDEYELDLEYEMSLQEAYDYYYGDDEFKFEK